MSEPSVFRLSFKDYLNAALLYLVITLLFFLPSLRFFSGSIIGPAEDNMFILWSLWYGSGSLANHTAGFMQTQQIFYPEGISLLFCNYYFYGVFLTVFLKLFLGLPLIYNLLVCHTFVLAGVGAFWLAQSLTGDRRASLLAGFIFAFNPSHFAHSLHHLTIASIQFVPFFVLFVLQAVKQEKKSAVAWASLFMILNALCDWNFLVFDFLFLGFIFLYLIFKYRKEAIRKMKYLLAIPAVTIFFLSPLIIPMTLVGLRQSFVGDLSGHDTYVADFFGFFVPHAYHLVFPLSQRIREINASMTGNAWESAVYLGLANLLVVAAAARWTWKKHKKYFLVIAVFMVLAMGVTPHFLGQSLPFPLPYRALQELPLLKQARNPSRIILYAYLFLALLTAFSFREIASRLRQGLAKKIILAVIILAVFFDFYSWSSAMTPVTLPPAYVQIQKDTEKDFGILELPWDGARYMMYQTLHGIPGVQGYMGRRVERTLSSRLVYDLKHLDVQKIMLIENRVKYIVLHKRRLTWDAAKAADIRYSLFLENASSIYSKTYQKIYEDEKAATFKVY